MDLWNDLLDRRKNFPLQFICELAGTSQLTAALITFLKADCLIGLLAYPVMRYAGHAGPLGSEANLLRMIKLADLETHLTLEEG